MDALRLILLLIGLAIVGFIFLRARNQQGKRLDILRHFDKTFISSFKSAKQTPTPVHPRRDATLNTEDIETLDTIVAERTDAAVEPSGLDISITTDDVQFANAEPLLVTLTIMARQGKLPGQLLSQALRDEGFRFGEMMAFHLHAQSDQKRGAAVCTILNVLEPGSFPDAELEGIDVPGIILLMQLPGPLEPRSAFERVLAVGQRLAATLNADLCDDHRNRLSQQGIAHLKDKIETYRLKQKMAQLKRRS